MLIIKQMFRNFLIFGLSEIALLILLECNLIVQSGNRRGVNYLILFSIPFILSLLSYIQAIAYMYSAIV